MLICRLIASLESKQERNAEQGIALPENNPDLVALMLDCCRETRNRGDFLAVLGGGRWMEQGERELTDYFLFPPTLYTFFHLHRTKFWVYRIFVSKGIKGL